MTKFKMTSYISSNCQVIISYNECNIFSIAVWEHESKDYVLHRWVGHGLNQFGIDPLYTEYHDEVIRVVGVDIL